jgi:hypothetical protein
MNSVLVTLVCKERWFLTVFGCALVAACALQLHDDFEQKFVYGGSLADLGLLLCALALLGGAWLGLREELTRTQEFLRHRPLAPEVAVSARGLGGAALVLCAPLAGGGIAVALDVGIGGAGVGIRAAAWASLAAVGAAGVCAFAASFLAGTLPLSWSARALALFGLLGAQLALQSWLNSVLTLSPWTLAVLAWGAALLLAARVAARRPRDLDRPPSAELLGQPLFVLTLAALLFGSLASLGWQKLAANPLAQARPWIGWTSDGRLVRCKDAGKPGSLAIVDEAGRPTGEDLDDDQPRVHAVRYTLPRARPFPEPGLRWFRAPTDGVSSRRWLVDAKGARWIETDLRGGKRRSIELSGPGELGDPRALELFESGADDVCTFVFAPGQALWRLRHDGIPRLERVELPGGALPVGTTHFWGSEDQWTRGRALETTDGAWLFENESWVRPEPGLYRQPRLVSTSPDSDPFTPLQRVAGPGGVSLDVRHPLDTPGKKALAVLMGCAAILRPPPLALASAALDYEAVAAEQPREFLVLFDPVIGGGYAWLLALNLLLHAWLAWSLSRELARRGLEPARRMRWVLAVLVAGIWIIAWAAALETRRAWKSSRSGPAPAPLLCATSERGGAESGLQRRATEPARS